MDLFENKISKLTATLDDIKEDNSSFSSEREILYKVLFDMKNDLNDLNAIQFAGLSASPPNAPILDYYNPDFITRRKSGMGAFRDLAELIMKAQNINIKF